MRHSRKTFPDRSPGTARQYGFGLIELLIVIVIIGILAMIAIPLYLDQRDKAKDAAVKAGVRGVQTAVVSYAADHDGLYPDPSQVAHDGAVAVYLDPWPDNPWTGAPMQDADEYSKGDFYYDAWSGEAVASLAFVLPEHEHFGLVGWTSNEEEPYVARPVRDTVFYSSTFASLDGLTRLSGTWEITEDGLRPSAKTKSGRLVFGDPAWEDVRIDVSAALAGKGAYELFYRSDGQKKIDGYRFLYDPRSGKTGRFFVQKYVDGKSKGNLARVDMPREFSAYGGEHKVTIEVVGEQHVVRVDGEPVAEFSDDTYTTGMAGLGKVAGGDVTFGSIDVTRPAGR